MSRIDTADRLPEPTVHDSSGWRELWRKEDWWAIGLGLGIVAPGLVLSAVVFAEHWTNLVR